MYQLLDSMVAVCDQEQTLEKNRKKRKIATLRSRQSSH